MTQTQVMQPLEKTQKNITVELLNALTHGIATVLSIIGTIFLVRKGLAQDSIVTITAYLIYGFSLILLFLNSTIYHSVSFKSYRWLFQKFDHSAIYLLIAGTYTPYLMIKIGGGIGYTFLFIVWALAFIGIYFEVRYTDRFPKLSTYMYLGLGWLGVLILYPLIQTVPLNALLLLALGGIIYSVGTIFYSMKHNRWMHVIWHLFVMGGAFFMFLSIYIYI